MTTRNIVPSLLSAPVLCALIAALFALPASARAQQPAPSADSSAAPGVQRPTVPLTVEERLAKLEAEVLALRQENQQLRGQIGISTAASAASSASDASAAPSAAAAVKADEAEQAAKKAAAETAAAIAAAQKPAAPKTEPGISVSAITPPKSEPSPAASAQAAESVKPAAAPPPIIKPAGNEQMLSVGGFIQAQAEFGNPIDSRFNSVLNDSSQNDRFYLRRARIVLGGHFTEDFDFKIAAEMTGALGASSAAMRGQLADGYISWTKFPALNLTIGQFKTSYGHEFLSNDLTIYPIEHALVTDILTLGRQIGGQASGTFLKTRFNYTFGVFNGNGVNTNVNDNNKFLYVGRINVAPVKEKLPVLGWDTIWTAGVNAYTSEDATITLPNGVNWAFPGRRTGWGVDTQVLVGPWDIWFEYLNTAFEPKNTDNPLGATKVTADGFYIQGSYSIVPKKWQLVLRYDVFDPNNENDNDETKTWTFGINWLIKGDDLKFMLNYMTSDPRFRVNGNKNEDRAGRVLLRMQAAF